MVNIRGDNPNNGSSDGLTIRDFAPLSPYVNFHPDHIPSQPEYIFPEGNGRQRGRFEIAFSQIGIACLAGAGIGGGRGLYQGLKATTLAGYTGRLRVTHLINHVMKNGASLANTLGVISLLYSSFDFLLYQARETDDSINQIVSSTATGLFYKSTAGLRKCGMAGGIGFGIGSLYCLWKNRNGIFPYRQYMDFA